MSGRGDAALPPRGREWRRRLPFVTAMVAWFLAPWWAIGSGTTRFDDAPDPRLGEVAHAAAEAAWMHQDNPIGRLLTPAARVQRVWREPGHCPRGEPGGQSPNAEYRAEVRFFTYFGIPAQTLHVSCGGWAWSIVPPARAGGA